MKYFLLSLALFALAFSAKAELPKDIYFHTISPSGGFYYDGVSDLLHDDVGYIWIVMSNDVFRFDGQQHKRYSTKFKKKGRPGTMIFKSIEKDNNGVLYVATTNGLYAYDRESDVFDCVLEGHWFDVKKDKAGKLWIYDANQIGFFDKDLNDFVFISSPLMKSTEKRFCARENDVLVGIRSKIYSVSLTGDNIELFYELPFDCAIVDIKEDKSTVWILTNNKGLFAIDSQTRKQVKKFSFFSTQNDELVPARTIYLQGSNIWVGTQRGLYIINALDGSYVNYTYSKQNKFGLPNSSIWKIYEDEQKNLWIGTYAGGLCYVDFVGNNRFKSYFYDKSPLSNNLVSCFEEDDNYLWVGTEGGGINRIEKKTDRFTYFTHKFNQPSLSYDNVKSLVMDGADNLWIGMYQAGLDCFDKKKGTFTNFKNKEHTNIRRVLLEPDSGLWISNQSNQYLSFFSFKDRSIKNYRIGEHGVLRDICKGIKNDVWAAKADVLFRINIADMEPDLVLLQEENPLKIETITVDNNGFVWIGTIDSGLLKYDPETDELHSYTDILKYNVYVIYSICFDNQGYPWLGTDNGLFKYDEKNNIFYKFDENDGIQGMTFYPKSCMKGEDGKLYFGGTNGFTIVYPNNVHVNEFKPKVVISDFYINNKLTTTSSEATPLERNVELTKEITLNHTNENFGFRFFSNNYINSGKNRFKYRLKGYDRDWIEVDASHNIVSYAKVPPGEYTFEVITANNSGIWNTEPTGITIKRLPSPFRSWWAYTIYAILSVLTVITIMRYYFRQKKLKMDLYLENMKTAQKEAAHQSQLRFFTNISHEFRTPLFLMIASLEKLKKDNNIEDKYFQLLTQNTHRLLSLINELMEFRTIENGQMKLNVAAYSLNEFVNDLAKDFHFYATEKHIQFSINNDEALIGHQYFDRQIMEKIVLNLLNNAFKFTAKEGQISVETYYSAIDFKPSYLNGYQEGNGIRENDFCIVVRDTGVGISKESIADVFIRFYKIGEPDNDRHIGSGIGLALVKSLVLLHKGTIAVYSERGKGSEFMVAFSRDQHVYAPKEMGEHIQEKSAFEESSLHFAHDAATEAEEDILNENIVPVFSEKKRILLVEDNEEIRFAISDIISEYFDIVEAANGVEATDILNAGQEVDMIISDVMMPLKDGVTLCRELKSDMNFSHIPFIMLTARSGTENRIEGVNSGADAYFEKPVNLKLLLLTIQNLFSQKQKMKDYYARNYFADSLELASNQQDNAFIEKLVEVIEQNIERSDIDVNYIASQLSMSRSKLYSKIKSMTDKSIVEFIRSYRLRKAAKLLAEENLPVNEVMQRVGIESDSYFAKAFKSEFGVTPSEFVKKLRKK